MTPNKTPSHSNVGKHQENSFLAARFRRAGSNLQAFNCKEESDLLYGLKVKGREMIDIYLTPDELEHYSPITGSLRIIRTGGTKWEPITVALAENTSVYAVEVKKAANCETFMNQLSDDDRQTIASLAALNPPNMRDYDYDYITTRLDRETREWSDPEPAYGDF